MKEPSFYIVFPFPNQRSKVPHVQDIRLPPTLTNLRLVNHRAFFLRLLSILKSKELKEPHVERERRHTTLKSICIVEASFSLLSFEIKDGKASYVESLLSF